MQHHKLRARIPGGFFYLEEERTKARVSGYGYGDHIKLKDEYGNEWLGAASLADDSSVTYRFRSSNGRTLSGVSAGSVLTLRDDNGSTWKGFVD